MNPADDGADPDVRLYCVLERFFDTFAKWILLRPLRWVIAGSVGPDE